MKFLKYKSNKLKFHFIIVEHNSKKYLDELISSIIGLIDEIKITIVNNKSNYSLEGLYDEKIEIINLETNIGYGAAINRVGLKSDSDFLCICNSDLVFLDDTFKNIKLFVDKYSNIELFCGQQITPNFRWHHSYGNYPSISQVIKNIFFITQIIKLLDILKFKMNIKSDLKSVNYLDGAFFIIKSKLFKKINGFDEDYFFYSEDADLCYRSKKIGVKSYFTSSFKLIHYRGASSEINLINENKAILFSKSYKLFLNKHYRKLSIKIIVILNKFQLNLTFIINGIAFILTQNKKLKTKLNNIKFIMRHF